MTEKQVFSEEERFELLIQGVLDAGYGFCDQFLDEEVIAGLRANILRHHKAGEMYTAGVGRKFDFQRNATIRGDVIRWIENDTIDLFEQAWILKVRTFIAYLNQTCYTSINDFEFHYAYYEQGSFYKRHLDQFKSNQGRKFSFVMYLNDDWKDTDGGNIVLYLNAEKEESLFPHGGRVVFFKSDKLEHEVKPSNSRYRLSIAGWLKSV
ncbi:MAG: 2OG-Fe(II) oxygenase [Bacteroidetes bacterium]|nr:2OG-Fe(II) oxygenase [Bacteroidota bacterium]